MFVFVDVGLALWQVLVTHIRDLAFPVGTGNEGVGNGGCFQPYPDDSGLVLLLKVADHGLICFCVDVSECNKK